MSAMRIERVLALPSTFTPSTMYIVKSAESPYAEIAFSNADGTEVRHVINKTEINDLISTAVASFSNILIVADITARNALTPDYNVLVLVTDATGDPTVTTGAALYIYNTANSTWTKVSEFESLDVVLDWASIQNKPVSTVADIDDAVTKRHTHTNKGLLDLLSVTSGHLYYNGQPVRPFLDQEDW